MRNHSKRILCSAWLSVMPVLVFAQAKDVTSFMSFLTSTSRSIASQAVSLVTVVVGIVGLVQLIQTFRKHSKGDPATADAYLKHGGGLILAAAFIFAINQFFFT